MNVYGNNARMHACDLCNFLCGGRMVQRQHQGPILALVRKNVVDRAPTTPERMIEEESKVYGKPIDSSKGAHNSCDQFANRDVWCIFLVL